MNTGKSGMSSSIYRKIMVATDGSEHVRKAIATAIEISKLSGAKLYAVYVMASDEFSMSDPKNAELEKAFVNYYRNEGKEATAYVETSAKAENVEVESVILEGSPAHEIINFAEGNDIDLIVMGTHGKSAIERFLLGSIAENVVRHSKKAVLVVWGKGTGKGK
jgi:nucleotide-binding universal stress UspA family protein